MEWVRLPLASSIPGEGGLVGNRAETDIATSAAFGTLSRGLTADGKSRLIGVELGEVIELGVRLHELMGASGDLFGQGVVASALLSSQIKGSERMTVQVQAERPHAGFICEVNADGALRARLGASRVHQAALEDVNGVLLAIKSVGNRELYRGVTSISGCSLAAALEEHLRDSQQVRSALRIHVDRSEAGQVRARGLLLEALPSSAADAGDDLVTESDLERAIQADDFDKAREDLCHRDDDGGVLAHQALFWSCPCSQERVENVVRMLGPQTMSEMIGEDEPAYVTCHFCNPTRHVSVARLVDLLVD